MFTGLFFHYLPVLAASIFLVCLEDGIASGGGEVCVLESLPDVLHGKWGRMNHVVGIEAVVAKFIEHDFVGWKISAFTMYDVRCTIY